MTGYEYTTWSSVTEPMLIHTPFYYLYHYYNLDSSSWCIIFTRSFSPLRDKKLRNIRVNMTAMGFWPDKDFILQIFLEIFIFPILLAQ